MKKRYDFIIIGGGPAGSTAATLLSRKGYSVLVLEKEKFPRPHVGESMLSNAYFLFEDLGVLEEMKKRFVRKPGVVFSNTSGSSFTEWPFQEVIKDDSYLSFHVKRADFDQLLLNNSKQAGAEIWEEAQVTAVDLESSEDSISVKGYLKAKEAFTLEARFLIDASGQSSFLANKFGSKIPFEKIGNRLAVNTHWTQVRFDAELAKGNLKIVHLNMEGGGWMWMIPVEEDKISVGIVMSNDYFKRCRKNLRPNNPEGWAEDLYRQLVFSSDVAAHVLEKAEMMAPLSMSGDYSYKNTRKYGSNFATIGDASAFIDPIFASGVYIAMNSAYLIVDALEEHLQSKESTALAKVYERIDGAYKVVEQLVLNYYDPEAIRVGDMQAFKDSSFEQQRTAIQIFHLLISGKFFDVPERYLNTIQLLRDHKKLEKFEHIIKSKRG